MKIAVMQPYFFPYIGYFQLIASVDRFIIYDDVNFIKSGWLNRNRIKINNKYHWYTIPTEKASSYKKIIDIKVKFSADKLLRTIWVNYRKSPYFEKIYHIIEKILTKKSRYLVDYSSSSIIEVCKYLYIPTEIIKSSYRYNNNYLNKEARVIDICLRENADTYINPIGGLGIYHKKNFLKKDIALHFLQTENIVYKQVNGPTFLPNLSIIDLLMNNSPQQIRSFFKLYKLL